eukprot:2936325-Pyramimonas_sp.AAC.1
MRRQAFSTVRPFPHSTVSQSDRLLHFHRAIPPGGRLLRLSCGGTENWFVRTRVFEHSLSQTELRGAWTAVWGQAKFTWGRVGGPVSALRRCL